MPGFIYLIKSNKNRKLYLGSTKIPNERLNQHNAGRVKATKYGAPWICLLIINVGAIQEARKAEYYIKRQKEKLTIENVVKLLNEYLDNRGP